MTRLLRALLRLPYHPRRLALPLALSRCLTLPASVAPTETSNLAMPPKEKKAKFDLKVPKGTKDWEGKDMVIRDKIFSSITDVFKRHGAVTIDTP